MDELSNFQRDLLYCLAEEDEPSGADLKRKLSSYYRKETNNGQLYPNLDTLTERGLVEKTPTDGRANAYALTQRGRKLISRRRQWEDESVEWLGGE